MSGGHKQRGERLCIVEDETSCIFGANDAWVFTMEIVLKALDVACCFPLGHGQVVEKIVATGGGSGAWYFVGIVNNVLEGTKHELAHQLAIPFALHDEIVASKASHRSPIDDAVFPFRVVAKECGNDVLDSVDGRNLQGRFLIGGCHTYVVCSDALIANFVLTRNVDARHKVAMVYLEGGY